MTHDPNRDILFTGSIPELYETYLVPMIFQPYADDLARRVDALGASAVLEIAAGSGVVTRAMADVLPDSTAITATDLNPPMLARAEAVGTSRPVSWRRADALSLPFNSGSFDAVVCQFGVMFFSDRVKALSEMHRVLRPGGTAIFNVWDRVETSEFAHTVNDALAIIYADDPPTFMQRIPHGYHDPARIVADVVAGFGIEPQIHPLEATSRAASADIPAIGFCQGTPLRHEIERRGPSRLGEVTATAAEKLRARFGNDRIEGRLRANIVSVSKG
jgi:SAM-dependent methyltransferase